MFLRNIVHTVHRIGGEEDLIDEFVSLRVYTFGLTCGIAPAFGFGPWEFWLDYVHVSEFCLRSIAEASLYFSVRDK